MTKYIPVAVLAAVLSLCAGLFAYIRWRYRRFCAIEEQKERISVLRRKVESARSYIRNNYNTAFDTSIQDNIVPKMEFLENLIMKKSLDDQEREFGFLLDMLTETFIRLRNFTDVKSVVAPLNSLRDRLVQEHLQYIREHMEEEI